MDGEIFNKKLFCFYGENRVCRKKRGNLTDIDMNWWDENLGSAEENSSLLSSCTLHAAWWVQLVLFARCQDTLCTNSCLTIISSRDKPGNRRPPTTFSSFLGVQSRVDLRNGRSSLVCLNFRKFETVTENSFLGADGCVFNGVWKILVKRIRESASNAMVSKILPEQRKQKQMELLKHQGFSIPSVSPTKMNLALKGSQAFKFPLQSQTLQLNFEFKVAAVWLLDLESALHHCASLSSFW